MAVEKKTYVDIVEIQMNGFVGIRFLLALVENEVTLSYTYHRTLIPPGHDPQLYIDATNQALAADDRGYPPIDPSHIAEIFAICELAHTTARIEAYEANMASQIEKWQP